MVWELTVDKDEERSRKLVSSLKLKSKLFGHSGTPTQIEYCPSYNVLVSSAENDAVIFLRFWTFSKNLLFYDKLPIKRIKAWISVISEGVPFGDH